MTVVESNESWTDLYGLATIHLKPINLFYQANPKNVLY
jgi:hypothetical protein